MDQRLQVLLLVLLLVGCDDRRVPSSYVDRRDSVGTEIVTYTSLVPTGSLDVAAEPELWIEGDERIPPFDRISAMGMLGDGRIVVADQGANQIHAFSPEGAYLWSVGRAGEGPGEFRRVNLLFVTPRDTILVVDPRLGRVTVVSSTGALIRDARLVSGAGAPAGLLSSGDLLYRDEEAAGERTAGVQHTSATWSAVDLAGASSRALATTPGTASYYGHGGGRAIVIRPTFMRRTFVASMRRGFVVSLSDRPNMDHYGPEGDLLRSVRLPDAVLSVEITDAQAVRDDLVRDMPESMRGALEELVADMPIPPRWPAVGALIVDDIHRLWVQAYRPDDVPETTWHVFTADGTYIDEVVTPDSFTPRVIRDGLIAGVWRDELEVQSIRVYRIEGT